MLGLSATLALLGLVTFTNAQAFLRNGGFESCTSENGDPAFWTQYMGSSEFVSCSAFQPKFGNWGTIVGDQVSSIGYQQASTLIAGQQYYAAYWLAHIAGNDGPVQSPGAYGFSVTVGATNASPTAAQLASAVNYLEQGESYGEYTLYTSRVFTARGNDLVRFQGFSNFGFFMIDDIALIPAGGPIPSGVFTRERARRDMAKIEKAKRENPDCPVGYKSCPISGLLGSSECIDPLNDLESCGGCVGSGKGVDCTLIAGALGVGCLEGSCVTFSCQTGFALHNDVCVEL